MKITEIEFGKLKMPLKTPFKTALRTIDCMEDVVIILHTDTGQRGFGSAPATALITGETHGSIIEAIRTVIMPAIVGEDVANLNRVVHLLQQSIVGNFSAKAAVEIALYDLFAQSFNAPLYRILGGGEPVISTDLTISVDYIDKMVKDALDAVARGFDALKIKVGKDLTLDIERVKAVYAAVGDKALIRLDANQGWTPKQTVSALRQLEEAGVELECIEQPVRGDDIEGMKYVTERVSTLVMADESSFGPREVIDLIRMRGADIINIKLMKTGGISNAVKIADIAAIYGVECMIGCMAETSIGVSAAAHVAVAKSTTITRIDLDSPSLAKVNPVIGGVTFDDAEIRISDAPGLGIESISELSMLKVG
ncbi:MAG: dipeptide epimerase [Proteobacteria bacterium]|nr:dipeptide epimerase [Pseudomonadota bacterium]